MARAFVQLRSQPFYRRDAFINGLERNGYKIINGMCNDPQEGDVLLIWNRYGVGDKQAQMFESRGLPVLVAENGYLGREWRGEVWYSISRNMHNGGGTWYEGWPDRWDSLNVELKPWRTKGDYILVLPQRGIGCDPVREPNGWALKQKLETDRPVVIRQHPGEKKATPLEQDLSGAHCVLTWASGGGIKALMNGVPVLNGYKDWIGAPAARLFDGDVETLNMGDRLPMFRRLSWAMWRLDEIERGDPFDLLLRR